MVPQMAAQKAASAVNLKNARERNDPPGNNAKNPLPHKPDNNLNPGNSLSNGQPCNPENSLNQWNASGFSEEQNTEIFAVALRKARLEVEKLQAEIDEIKAETVRKEAESKARIEALQRWASAPNEPAQGEDSDDDTLEIPQEASTVAAFFYTSSS